MDAIKRTAETTNKMQALLAQNGFTLFQHNHNFEFERLEGTLKYAIYAELCPEVKFQMDSFWSTNFGTEDAVEMLKLKPAAEHPDEYWDKVMEVNLNSQFVISREIGKDMVARGSGKIIFTASLLTFQGGISVPGYAASKGGIGQLTMALANEWAGKGVNVNAIAPGYMVPPTIPRPCKTTPSAALRFWGASRPVAGAHPRISRALPFSWLPRPPAT
jgi:NAD(P)-dependent dehydrogenase (short-subunit alcohol dehydrogenase family)